MISEVKARLLKSTNEYVSGRYLGTIFICRMCNNNQFLMNNENEYILTSKVKEYIQKGRKINLKTLNSIYELEIIL